MYWHLILTLLSPLGFEIGVTHRVTESDGQTDYRNPPCACAARVNMLRTESERGLYHLWLFSLMDQNLILLFVMFVYVFCVSVASLLLRLVHSRVCVFCNVLSRRGQLVNFDFDFDFDIIAISRSFRVTTNSNYRQTRRRTDLSLLLNFWDGSQVLQIVPLFYRPRQQTTLNL